MQIDRNEFLRCLGWRGQETDEAFTKKLDGAAKRCLELAAPRSVCRRFALTEEMELAGTGVFCLFPDVGLFYIFCGFERTYLLFCCIPKHHRLLVYTSI